MKTTLCRSIVAVVAVVWSRLSSFVAVEPVIYILRIYCTYTRNSHLHSVVHLWPRTCSHVTQTDHQRQPISHSNAFAYTNKQSVTEYLTELNVIGGGTCAPPVPHTIFLPPGYCYHHYFELTGNDLWTNQSIGIILCFVWRVFLCFASWTVSRICAGIKAKRIAFEYDFAHMDGRRSHFSRELIESLDGRFSHN